MEVVGLHLLNSWNVGWSTQSETSKHLNGLGGVTHFGWHLLLLTLTFLEDRGQTGIRKSHWKGNSSSLGRWIAWLHQLMLHSTRVSWTKFVHVYGMNFSVFFPRPSWYSCSMFHSGWVYLLARTYQTICTHALLRIFLCESHAALSIRWYVEGNMREPAPEYWVPAVMLFLQLREITKAYKQHRSLVSKRQDKRTT